MSIRDEFGVNKRAKQLKDSRMVRRIYEIPAGHQMQIPGGQVVDIPATQLQYLEIAQPGRESAHARMFATPVPAHLKDALNRKYEFTDNLQANYWKFTQITRHALAQHAANISDQTGIDPTILNARVAQRMGATGVRARTGRLTVVADATIPVDPRLLQKDRNGNPIIDLRTDVPPDLTISYKIIPDSDGNRKIAVNPIMARFNLDFDGDQVEYEELRMWVEGKRVRTNRLTKFPLMNAYGGFEKVTGSELEGLKLLRGVTGSDISELFGLPELKKRAAEFGLTEAEVVQLAQSDPRKARSMMRQALRNTLAENRTNSEGRMRAGIEKSLAPDIIGQLHNRTRAKQLSLGYSFLQAKAEAGEEWAARIVNDPQAASNFVSSVYGRFEGMGLGEDIQFTGQRGQDVEAGIKSAARGKLSDMSGNRILKMNVGIHGPEKLRNTKHILERTSAQHLEMMQLANNGDDFVSGLIGWMKGGGSSADDIRTVGPIKNVIQTVDSRANPGENAVRQMIRSQQLQYRNVRVTSQISDLVSNLTFVEHNTEDGWKPLLGGVTEHYGSTKVRIGYALPGVGTWNNGKFELLTGSEFFEQQAARHLQEWSVEDFKTGRRMIGQAAGRFDPKRLQSREGIEDRIALRKAYGQKRGKLMEDWEALQMIREGRYQELINAHDEKMYTSKYKAFRSFAEEHLGRYGQQVNYMVEGGVTHISESDRALSRKWIMLDLGLQTNDPEVVLSRLKSIPRNVADRLDLGYLKARSGQGRLKSAFRALIRNDSLYDPKRQLDVISQSYGSAVAPMNVGYAVMDKQRILQQIQKKYPDATLADVERLYSEEIPNGVAEPGEGAVWVLQSGRRKIENVWKNRQVLSPGYEGWDPELGRPRNIISKLVGPGIKSEVMEARGVSGMVDGHELDVLMSVGNIRGGAAGLAGVMAEAGQKTLKTSMLTLSGKLEGVQIPILFVPNSMSYGMTSKPTDQQGGYVHGGVGAREVLGPENLSYEISGTVNDWKVVTEKRLGRPLTEAEIAEHLPKLARGIYDLAGKQVQETLGDHTIDIRESNFQLGNLTDLLSGNQPAVDQLMMDTMNRLVKSKSVQAAEHMGMLDAAAEGLRLLGSL